MVFCYSSLNGLRYPASRVARPWAKSFGRPINTSSDFESKIGVAKKLGPCKVFFYWWKLGQWSCILFRAAVSGAQRPWCQQCPPQHRMRWCLCPARSAAWFWTLFLVTLCQALFSVPSTIFMCFPIFLFYKLLHCITDIEKVVYI